MNGQIPPPQPPHFRPPNRGGGFTYVLIFALLLTVAYYIFNPQGSATDPQATEIPISQLVQQYQSGQFSEVTIKNSKVYATSKGNKKFYAIRPEGEGLSDLGLNQSGNPTPVSVISTERSAFWGNVIANWLPIIIFIALI
ncbi:MAG: ATP-dependent metallopeptidase FtsH/Yme1/Tma family protein, partial [Candidatus Peregrinibacteria bacterium]